MAPISSFSQLVVILILVGFRLKLQSKISLADPCMQKPRTLVSIQKRLLSGSRLTGIQQLRLTSQLRVMSQMFLQLWLVDEIILKTFSLVIPFVMIVHKAGYVLFPVISLQHNDNIPSVIPLTVSGN